MSNSIKIDIKRTLAGFFFNTFQVPTGTSPTADGANDTLTLTSTDNSVTITGDATTDTINFAVNPATVGDVDGPASSTDNAVVRFDGTTGKLIQNSSVIISDTNDVTGIASLTATNAILSGQTANRATYFNASKQLTASATTDTELGYLSGVTSAIQTQIDLKAPLASPALTGTPTSPTATLGTNTTQIATTAFVQAALAAVDTSLNHEYFVDKTGNDTTGDGSLAKPFLTIQKAYDTMGAAANSSDYEDTTKRFWKVVALNGTYTENITVPTRMVQVLDLSNSVLVGNITYDFDKGIASGATTKQPKFIILGSDLRASYTGSNIPLSCVNGNLTWSYKNGGSSVTCQLMLIDAGISGTVATATGSGGNTNGVLQIYATESYITGQITSPTGTTALFFDSCGDDTVGMGGCSGAVKLQMMRNVRFAGTVSTNQNHANCQWLNVTFITGSSSTGASGAISMDSVSWKSYNTNFTTKGSETVTFLDDAQGVGFTPAVSGNWSVVPTQVKGALDTLAADKVTGPSSSIDNRIVRFDGTTGKLVQGSNLNLMDDGSITGSVTVGTSNPYIRNITATDTSINTTTLVRGDYVTLNVYASNQPIGQKIGSRVGINDVLGSGGGVSISASYYTYYSELFTIDNEDDRYTGKAYGYYHTGSAACYDDRVGVYIDKVYGTSRFVGSENMKIRGVVVNDLYVNSTLGDNTAYGIEVGQTGILSTFSNQAVAGIKIGVVTVSAGSADPTGLDIATPVSTGSGTAKAIYARGGLSQFGGAVQLDTTTASRAVVTDSNKRLISSATTATELGYVSGVTSAIQTQIDSLSADAYWMAIAL
jgi:hypothetical protein